MGIEPRTSGVGSDRSTNWATTTALIFLPLEELCSIEQGPESLGWLLLRKYWVTNSSYLCPSFRALPYEDKTVTAKRPLALVYAWLVFKWKNYDRLEANAWLARLCHLIQAHNHYDQLNWHNCLSLSRVRRDEGDWRVVLQPLPSHAPVSAGNDPVSGFHREPVGRAPVRLRQMRPHLEEAERQDDPDAEFRLHRVHDQPEWDFFATALDLIFVCSHHILSLFYSFKCAFPSLLRIFGSPTKN